MMNQQIPKVQYIVSKLISLWMCVVIITISLLLKYENNEDKDFYKFGPNKDLLILGFSINNNKKYIYVVSYCFINSLLRTLYNSVLHPWLINNVQDESKEKRIELRYFSYEVTIVTTIYMWFDWFIYMNILLSQIDMVLIEIFADVIMSILTTMYYLDEIKVSIFRLPLKNNYIQLNSD